MQPAPIHDGGHPTPGWTPHARTPFPSGLAGTLLKAAVIGALTVAGWLVLSALAGPQASADAGGGLGDAVRGLDSVTVRTPGHARPAPDTVGDLVSTVSKRDAARRLPVSDLTDSVVANSVSTDSVSTDSVPADSVPAVSRGVPAADGLLSSLTLDHGASSTTDGARTSATAPDDGGPGRGKPGPDTVRPGASKTGGCHACTGHGPSAPRLDLPTSKDDLSGVFSQAGQAPGPIAGTLPSLIEAAPPARGVRPVPATVLKDRSSPARPMVVPD